MREERYAFIGSQPMSVGMGSMHQERICILGGALMEGSLLAFAKKKN
jgi:hypothetical protein